MSKRNGKAANLSGSDFLAELERVRLGGEPSQNIALFIKSMTGTQYERNVEALVEIGRRLPDITNEVAALQATLANGSVLSWARHVKEHPPSPEAIAFLVLANEDRLRQEAANKATSKGKKAADALHNKPGGSREKQDAIRSAWARGTYKSRDDCAEQECAYQGMSLSAARKALRNTPEPVRPSTKQIR